MRSHIWEILDWVRSWCGRLKVWPGVTANPWGLVCSLSWEWIILAFTHPLRQCMRAAYVMSVSTHGENALQIRAYFHSFLFSTGTAKRASKMYINSIFNIHRVFIQAVKLLWLLPYEEQRTISFLRSPRWFVCQFLVCWPSSNSNTLWLTLSVFNPTFIPQRKSFSFFSFSSLPSGRCHSGCFVYRSFSITLPDHHSIHSVKGKLLSSF